MSPTRLWLGNEIIVETFFQVHTLAHTRIRASKAGDAAGSWLGGGVDGKDLKRLVKHYFSGIVQK